MESAECQLLAESAAEVRKATNKGDIGAATAVTTALLIHHATLNPSLHPGCWTKYLYPKQHDFAGAEIEANLAMASVAILAMTALPANGKYSFQRIDYRWIELGTVEQLSKVNSTLGLSRKMLCLIYGITLQAKVFYPNSRSY